jgi:hypothetical protein
MKELNLSVGGHTITVQLAGGCGVISGGTISSDLHEPEPYPCPEDEDECEANSDWLDTEHEVTLVESLVLAHACAGVDVGAAAYLEGLETVLDEIFR